MGETISLIILSVTVLYLLIECARLNRSTVKKEGFERELRYQESIIKKLIDLEKKIGREHSYSLMGGGRIRPTGLFARFEAMEKELGIEYHAKTERIVEAYYKSVKPKKTK